jgi:multidrug efflux pump subunit AcrB
MMKKMKELLTGAKEFKPTSWAIDNKTAIYLLILIVSFIGIRLFVTLPKEQFPDIVLPTIYVQTVYVGNSPKDIENLVTKPIEKQIKGISGAKINKVTSTSQQDFSAVIVEFDTDVATDEALRKVKDAVDKAKSDLPQDLTVEPNVLEVSFSDFPIMYVNVSGNYDLMRLKKIADEMKDNIEDLTQVNRVDIVGAPEREFQINVDRLRMQAAGVTYEDIANAIARENNDISGGQVDMGNMKRTLQIKAQFKTVFDIQKVIVNNIYSAPVYLKDIATIKDTVKTSESYARLNGKDVITLNIIKRPGENLIETSDAVKAIIENMQVQSLPKDLTIAVTGDLSKATRTSFNELINSIVIGFVLVLIILMFFMGVVNAFFVALSVPLSMFVAFMFLPGADLIVGTHVTLNFIVLFALLFGLGIIVDDAIVVIENTHRIFMHSHGKLNSSMAAKYAAGEVFVPVLAGTLTTLAPFFPLLFWPGIIGKFMIYLPTILIFTLVASLIVAFIMNPVFAVDFMNHDERQEKKTDIFKKPILYILLVSGVMLDLLQQTFTGNLLIFIALLIILNAFVIKDLIHGFQNKVLPWIMRQYENLLKWALAGWRPFHLLLITIVLMIFSGILFSLNTPAASLFPSGDPNQIYIYIKLPVGTDVEHTNEVTKQLEDKVYSILGIENGKQNPLVESVISNVAVGANDPNSGDQSAHPELGRIQISFVEFEKRDGVSTQPFLDTLRSRFKSMPGAEITVDKENGGPPTEPPVSIEVISEDFDALIQTSVRLKNYIDSLQLANLPPIKMNVDLSNPEISITVDREKCMMYGLTTGQVGMELRTALFGREVSKIKEGSDEYKIQLRNADNQRGLNQLLNMSITFRDFATGAVKQVPIISLVNVDYTNTLGSVKRKNYDRTIILNSNADPSLAAAINQELAPYLESFPNKPANVKIQLAGADQQMVETFNFLGSALLIAFGLILIILVLQFNSISKPIIILSEVLFSVIGVLFGYGITGMQPSTVMTGIGIVGLAGIVVKNGILVIEFADELRARGMKTRAAVIEAGKTRIIPVLLTALAAILALIPLAVGFNINFITLFSELNPHIFFGGDNVVFWKPLSWTIIFGLAFAFFMTLFIVPAMYLMAERLKRPMRKLYGGRWVSLMGIPPLTIIFLLMIAVTVVYHFIKINRRRVRLKGQQVNNTFLKSWI